MSISEALVAAASAPYVAPLTVDGQEGWLGVFVGTRCCFRCKPRLDDGAPASPDAWERFYARCRSSLGAHLPVEHRSHLPRLYRELGIPEEQVLAADQNAVWSDPPYDNSTAASWDPEALRRQGEAIAKALDREAALRAGTCKGEPISTVCACTDAQQEIRTAEIKARLRELQRERDSVTGWDPEGAWDNE